MKRILGAAGAAFVAMTLSTTMADAASPARVSVDLNVRAGPGTQYPAVTVFPRGSRVNVIGCTSGIRWCDVSSRGTRGWVSARYLEFSHRGDRLIGPAYGAQIGLPIISFQIGNYWDRHYRGRPWYDQRTRFGPPRHDRWEQRRWEKRRDSRWADDRDRHWRGDRERRWDGDRERRWDRDRERQWYGDRERRWRPDRDRHWN